MAIKEDNPKQRKQVQTLNRIDLEIFLINDEHWWDIFHFGVLSPLQMSLFCGVSNLFLYQHLIKGKHIWSTLTSAKHLHWTSACWYNKVYTIVQMRYSPLSPKAWCFTSDPISIDIHRYYHRPPLITRPTASRRQFSGKDSTLSYWTRL